MKIMQRNMMMTNRGTHKRRRLACWLPRKTNREGVKGRMIGSRSQIVPTNFSGNPNARIFKYRRNFSHNLRNPTSPGDSKSSSDAIKQICFQLNIWQRCPDNQIKADQISIFVEQSGPGTESKDCKGIVYLVILYMKNLLPDVKKFPKLHKLIFGTDRSQKPDGDICE